MKGNLGGVYVGAARLRVSEVVNTRMSNHVVIARSEQDLGDLWLDQSPTSLSREFSA